MSTATCKRDMHLYFPGATTMILGKLYSLRMASDDINRGLQPKHNTLIPSNLWIPYNIIQAVCLHGAHITWLV